MTELRIGTSAFTAAGWEQAFYSAGMKPADYLSYYAPPNPNCFQRVVGRCSNKTRRSKNWPQFTTGPIC
jgi:hypothetical protein